jgi:hypothetical protein
MDLDFQEKYRLIGQIVHLVQNDSESFIAITSLVRGAEASGKLEGVKVLPECP